ncbi:unnamed protein product, partial [marine sediment metagenome]
MNVTVETKDRQADRCLELMHKDYDECVACMIGQLAHRKCYVRGTLPCKILFYGMGPGRRENIRGIPFVGDSGEVLQSLTYPLRAAKSKHRIAYAFTNLIACRPCDRIGGPNRD